MATITMHASWYHTWKKKLGKYTKTVETQIHLGIKRQKVYILVKEVEWLPRT